jgi:PAS domain S-box-containing protein
VNAQPLPLPELPAVRSGDTLLERQRQVLELIIRGAPLAEVLGTLCRIAEAEADAPVRAGILLVDADGRHLRAGAAPSLPDDYNRAVDGVPVSPDIGTCARAAAINQVVVTPCIATDPGWALLKHLPLALGLQAAWSMPIASADGQVLGTFGTYFPEQREPTAAERELVAVLAQTAALAIERDRSDAGARAAAATHRLLAELASCLQTLEDPVAVMDAAARLLGEQLGVDRVAYGEADGGDFVFLGGWSPHLPALLGREPIAGFTAPSAEAARSGATLVVADAATDPRIGPDALAAYRAVSVAALVFAPLHKAGRFNAGLAVQQAQPRAWTDEEVRLIEQVASRCWETIERVRVTRELRDSETRHRLMVEANPECVALVAADGTLLQANPAGLRLLEADCVADVAGLAMHELVERSYLPAYAGFHAAVCAGQVATAAFDLVGLRGARRAVEAHAVPWPAPGGGFHQLAVMRDVSERAAADRALAQSRARLDYAVRLSGVGFWYCDLPFDTLEWDAQVRAHFFVDAHETVTIDLFYERIHPEDRDPTHLAIQASIDSGAPYDVVYRTCDPHSDAVNWIRALGGTTFGADGTPVRFDGVTIDVSRQKRDEERLARLLAGERDHALVLAGIAEAASALHACTSVQAVLASLADATRRLLGAGVAAVTLLDDDDSDRREQATAGDKANAAALAATGLALHAQLAAPNRSHRLEAGELAAHGAWDAAAPPDGWLAVPLLAHDRSPLGLVQAFDRAGGFSLADEAVLAQLGRFATVALENARLVERLREQDQRKDEFIATLAHELRNPLAPIRTGLNILRMTSDPDAARRSREVMERQLAHLVRLVDDLLDVSRIRSGKVALVRETIDVGIVVDTALEASRPLIEAQGHTLHVDVPAEMLLVDADATRLAQVVANLLNNAAKYTPRGGHIGLRVAAEGDRLGIRVRDNGIGIDAKVLPRIFDLFVQADAGPDHAPGGLGIGLTLVRRLLELHGGGIEAHSEGPGHGSTFTAWLPLRRA